MTFKFHPGKLDQKVVIASILNGSFINHQVFNVFITVLIVFFWVSSLGNTHSTFKGSKFDVWYQGHGFSIFLYGFKQFSIFFMFNSFQKVSSSLIFNGSKFFLGVFLDVIWIIP